MSENETYIDRLVYRTPPRNISLVVHDLLSARADLAACHWARNMSCQAAACQKRMMAEVRRSPSAFAKSSPCFQPRNALVSNSDRAAIAALLALRRSAVAWRINDQVCGEIHAFFGLAFFLGKHNSAARETNVSIWSYACCAGAASVDALTEASKLQNSRVNSLSFKSVGQTNLLRWFFQTSPSPEGTLAIVAVTRQ